MELERVCCGVELAAGKSKSRGDEIGRITRGEGKGCKTKKSWCAHTERWIWL